MLFQVGGKTCNLSVQRLTAAPLRKRSLSRRQIACGQIGARQSPKANDVAAAGAKSGLQIGNRGDPILLCGQAGAPDCAFERLGMRRLGRETSDKVKGLLAAIAADV